MALLRKTASEKRNVSHLVCARKHMNDMPGRVGTRLMAYWASRIEDEKLRIALDHLGVHPDVNSDVYATLFGGAV